jgi:hypothetical protein
MLLLERWFSAWRGVAFRIRRIDLAAIRAGATLDGPIVLSADMSSQIDNMEGIAVHRNGEGETIITLVSDNNFSFLQRTLLLQFAYRGLGAGPAPDSQNSRGLWHGPEKRV